MIISETNIDEYGLVHGFRLHDAGFIGLSYEDAGSLEIRLRRVDGVIATVTLRSIGDIGLVGFRNGAIVSELFVWNPAEATLDRAIPRNAWAVLFGNDIPVEDLPDAVSPIVRRNEFNHLAFLQCSYGGELAALCAAIEIKATP